jgi:hypothetical protein
MDPVEFSQYQTWKDSFARAGTNVEAAYTPAGEIDYMYVVGRLLARAGSVGALQVAMPEVDLAGSNEQPRSRPAIHRWCSDRPGCSGYPNRPRGAGLH